MMRPADAFNALAHSIKDETDEKVRQILRQMELGDLDELNDGLDRLAALVDRESIRRREARP